MTKKMKFNFYEAVEKKAKESQRHDTRSLSLRLDHAIRNLRESKEISGADLCRRAGDLDPKTLTAVEKGRIVNPSLKTLESIARGLNVAVSDLFRDAEVEVVTNLYAGSQKGFFTLDFPKWGVKVISFTPFVRELFCGKLILSPKKCIDDMLLKNSVPVYISVMIGRADFTVGKKQFSLREGENVYFNGNLPHSIANPLQRDTTLQLVTAPSFF